ncbi:MAG: glutathione S-transferase family protein [Burkholderiales bacterium]|nr:glutathione S-transferase family protein [Burkholderiales bacterium]MDE2454927.1 glutathione S-transferase family protein [Burkholderiales bacterium]
MTELILHQYEGSPFAEKARLMLGFKGLAWRAVAIPQIMPKPDLVALTGGYRKTPVLQVGADVYCDTALIARRLEQEAPEPTLFPAAAPLAPMLAQWADTTLFWTMIPVAMQPAGIAKIFAGVGPEVVKAFGADRASFTSGMRRQSFVDASANLGLILARFESQLGDGRRFLFGDAASIADFSLAHNLWFLRRAGLREAWIDRHGSVSAWFDRVLGFGHGTSRPLDAAQALAIAAAAPGHAACEVGPGLGFEAGAAVTVAATDYGVDPVAGRLVGLTAEEVVVERRDERAGAVHVHFPRTGYQIRKQEAA